MKKLVVAIVAAAATAVAVAFFAYPAMEGRYQRSMDSIRIAHAHQIADVVREFADKTGHLPFQEHADDKPFMVLIGHSSREEDRFAGDAVLKRNATWTNGSELEALLAKELNRTVRLPRDPQKVSTFAPNVYVYFVSRNQVTVLSHLNSRANGAVKYEWNGHPFYAYTICHAFEARSPKLRRCVAATLGTVHSGRWLRFSTMDDRYRPRGLAVVRVDCESCRAGFTDVTLRLLENYAAKTVVRLHLRGNRREIHCRHRRIGRGFSASVPGLPGCHSQGATEAEAIANIERPSASTWTLSRNSPSRAERNKLRSRFNPRRRSSRLYQSSAL